MSLLKKTVLENNVAVAKSTDQAVNSVAKNAQSVNIMMAMMAEALEATIAGFSELAEGQESMNKVRISPADVMPCSDLFCRISKPFPSRRVNWHRTLTTAAASSPKLRLWPTTLSRPWTRLQRPLPTSRKRWTTLRNGATSLAAMWLTLSLAPSSALSVSALVYPLP